MKAISSNPRAGYINILVVEGEGDDIRIIASISKRLDTSVVSFYEEYKVSLICIFDPDLFEKYITRMKKEIEPPDAYRKLLPGWKDISAMWSTYLTVEEEIDILSKAVSLWRMYLHYLKEKNRLYIRHPGLFKEKRVNESGNVVSVLTRLIDFSSDGVYYIKNNPTEMDMRVYRISEVLDSYFERTLVSEATVEYIEKYGREKTIEALELLAISEIHLEDMLGAVYDSSFPYIKILDDMGNLVYIVWDSEEGIEKDCWTPYHINDKKLFKRIHKRLTKRNGKFFFDLVAELTEEEELYLAIVFGGYVPR